MTADAGEIDTREPRFSITCQLEAKGIQPVTFVYTGERPKELMDAYSQLIGDAHAGISVSTDLSLKKFGSGASGMVTISLTCNQDQNTMMAALELAAQMGRWFAKKHQGEAEAEFRNLLLSQGRNPDF